MNNGTANATSISNTVISESYLNYVVALVDVSMLSVYITQYLQGQFNDESNTSVLLFHAMVSAIPPEMKFMWFSSRPFSIVNLLYTFTRYGSLISQGLVFWADLLPLGSLDDVANTLSILGYVGVQGLLITRAYSLCSGHKVIAGVLAFFFLGGLISNIYDAILNGRCFQSSGAEIVLATLVASICVILTDLLVFCICLWKVWGTWKLKRETGIQGNNNLASVLLRQTVSRFCFVVIITFTVTTLNCFVNDFLVAILVRLQHTFSAILLADFTLDLRQRNFAAIQATNPTLPSIRFQSVGDYIHQSVLVEMGDGENADMREGDDDSFSRYPDVEIQNEESAQDYTWLLHQQQKSVNFYVTNYLSWLKRD